MNTDLLNKAVKKVLYEILSEQSQDKKPSAEKSKAPAEKSPKAAPQTDQKPKRKKKTKSRAAPGSIGIATGAVGSGRFTAATTAAGARAQKDPEGLMQDLGVKQATGDDLEQVLAVMNAAILSNDIMGQAYAGATFTQEQTPDGKLIDVVGITNAGINTRNAIKFLSHTLIAAQNAGILNLTRAIEINQGRNAPVIVYAT